MRLEYRVRSLSARSRQNGLFFYHHNKWGGRLAYFSPNTTNYFMRYFQTTIMSTVGLLAALIFDNGLHLYGCLDLYTCPPTRNAVPLGNTYPSYGNTMSMGLSEFSQAEDVLHSSVRSTVRGHYISCQTPSVPQEELTTLSAELTQLKKDRPKNSSDFQKQQLAIQRIAAQAMKIISERQSEPYLQFERDWLLSSALLINKSYPRNEPTPQNEILSVEEILKNWSDYAQRRQMLDLSDLRLMSMMAKNFEANCEASTAARSYELFLNTIVGTKSNNTRAGIQIKGDSEGSYKQLEVIFAGAIRRLKLVGTPMTLEGKTFEGMDFNLESYHGKVVLVDYWATWCGPCVAEYPQIRDLWEKYHETGFEVVGVSMDADRESLAKYIQEKAVPWVVLNDEKQEGKHPSTEYYSIQTVPAMFLIGRDGKVISTQIEVPKLEPLLQNALKLP